MATTMSQVSDLKASYEGVRGKTGLQVGRYFSRAGVEPYDEVEWELRSASITNEKGKVVETWIYDKPQRKFVFIDQQGVGEFSLES